MSRSLARRLSSLALTALIAASALLATTAAPAAADGGSAFVAMTNEHRANRGIGPVALHAAIDQIAVERAVQISRDGGWDHDFEYIKRRFSELGVCWQAFGEIIAYNSTGSIETFGQQWMNSDGHRAIMLSEDYAFTHAGGSRHQAGDRWYAAMVFVKLCGAPAPQPPSTTIAGFTDIADSTFKVDITWLVNEKITYGCTDTRFCPVDAVSRGQMASFLRRVLNLPPATRDWFTDDAGSTHEDAINRVADAGLAHGCSDTRFCPDTRITRAQMASFLTRALGLPPALRDHFTDDAASGHEDAINRVADAGLAYGCADGRFCPDASVTREQMAAFLRRGFE